MHMGVTTGADAARPFARLDDGANDGAVCDDGRVIGTYCHGLIASV
jgi:adenosylcobyric acid synthase